MSTREILLCLGFRALMHSDFNGVFSHAGRREYLPEAICTFLHLKMPLSFGFTSGRESQEHPFSHESLLPKATRQSEEQLLSLCASGRIWNTLEVTRVAVHMGVWACAACAHTRVGVSEPLRGSSGFGCIYSMRLQMQLRMNKSQSKAIKCGPYVKCFF